MSRAERLTFPSLIPSSVGKYLVVGDSETARVRVSAWIEQVICQKNNAQDSQALNPKQACGVCLDCLCFKQGHHPDYFSLSSEGVGKQISIEQIRALIQFLSYTPQQAKHRVMVIWEADRLTVAAANAFLKTLEEPVTESVLMILVTAQPSLLPETVRSRCFKIRLMALSVHKKSAFAWTAEDDQLLLAYQQVFEKPGELFKIVDKITKSRDLRELLYSLLKIGHLMAQQVINGDVVSTEGLSAHGQQFLSQLSRHLGGSLWSWVDRIYENMQGIQQGVALNPLLLLESLFIHKEGGQLDGGRIVSDNKR